MPNNSKLYGYARVSTTGQNEDRQMVALTEFGVQEKNIILDKVSGKDFNRPGYKRLIKMLRQGDTLVISSVDRLGRDYEEIIEQWRKITKEVKAFIVVIDLPILDTRMKNEYDITGTLIADVVLALFGYVAQMERENIRSRQAEGIAVAKAKGVAFGRPPKEKPLELDVYIEKYLLRDVSSREAAKAIGIPQSTFLKWVQEQCQIIET
jgi:DNA invertase Pin-like site-specific DNA recombinase